MCGIVGIFSPRDGEKRWPADTMGRMVAAVRYRGPDGTGIHHEPGLFLGHARLAVLDPSPAGSQPMFSSDRRYVVACNGEIYNFRELRAELEGRGHRFRTRSDTEVLLAAWQEWGEQALDRLDGMFAFALHDRREKVLYLARDPLGIKPLFYQEIGGAVHFASELLALFSSVNPCPGENAEDLDSYFTFNYLPAPRTGLQGVGQLPPGCLLRIDREGKRLRRYWCPAYEAEPLPWNEETIDRFRQLLYDTVRRQTVSDVPIGLFLSGGLDSYSVALATVACGESPTAFTLAFAEEKFDESAAAAEFAHHLGICGRAVPFALDAAMIERTLAAMGELLADPSCFPLFQLAAAARREATVVLAGDGGDELLAGYDTYRAGELTPLIRLLPAPLRRSMRGVISHLPSGGRRYGLRMVAGRFLDAAEAGPRRDHATFRRIFSDEMKRRLYSSELLHAVAGHDPVEEYVGLMDQVPAGRSYLTARQHADIAFHLPAILAKVDRMSMAHALEVRVPLLGRGMVDFCLNLDDAARRNLFAGKRILRKVLSGSIPASALKRPKAGFLPPVESWFREAGPMSAIFGDALVTARHSLQTLRWDEVERLWEEHRQGRVDAGFVLLGILQYINWSGKCKRLSP